MFSSVGQIIGLIEIEPASDCDELLASLEPAAGCSASAADTSLDALFARLASRCDYGREEVLTEKSASPARAANRLVQAGVLPLEEMPVVADLGQLESDLAAATAWLRLQLVEAATRAARR